MLSPCKVEQSHYLETAPKDHSHHQTLHVTSKYQNVHMWAWKKWLGFANYPFLSACQRQIKNNSCTWTPCIWRYLEVSISIPIEEEDKPWVLEMDEAKLDHSGAAVPGIVAGIENVARRAVALVSCPSSHRKSQVIQSLAPSTTTSQPHVAGKEAGYQQQCSPILNPSFSSQGCVSLFRSRWMADFIWLLVLF